MEVFRNSITEFLSDKGFCCTDVTSEDMDIGKGMRILLARHPERTGSGRIILLSPVAETCEEATEISDAIWKAISEMRKSDERQPVIITEDRWNSDRTITGDRLLAHLEDFFPVYARNCEARRIDKAMAAEFLSHTHSYGDASCRYRYGLFLKRHTGHIAEQVSSTGCGIKPGDMIAAATFSNARKWHKGDKVIRSYEWTRYASLPGIRVIGGMGKLLDLFIEDVSPDDIMSYADLEWSEGNAYAQLGFIMEGYKEPVCFKVDTETWKRSAISGNDAGKQDRERFFTNFGSAKFRLKLTEYD